MADEFGVDAYKANFKNVVFSGFVSLAVGLGSNLGLIEELKNLQQPEDADTIAKNTNLNKRYVKEWLGCMVAAKIVFMEDDDKYYIPEKYKGCLMPSWYAPFVSILGSREDVIEGFFQSEETSGKDLYAGEFGRLFYNWRDKERLAFVDDRLGKGVTATLKEYHAEDSLKMALEVGCGTGILTTAFAKKYPEATVIGIEICEEALKRAKSYVQKAGVKNTQILAVDASKLPDDWTSKFDVIFMFDTFHDIADPDGAIEELKRVLKDDGIMTIVEPKLSSHHQNNQGDIIAAAYYGISVFNCLPCGLATEPAAGLGIAWGVEKATEFFNKHGFDVKDVKEYSFNERSNLFVLKKKK